MNQLIRILNDGDRETLAWLRKHVGDVRVAAAARHLGGNGKPYVSAVCRYLGVRPPMPHQHSRPVDPPGVGTAKPGVVEASTLMSRVLRKITA
jgi:hypothetical protein